MKLSIKNWAEEDRPREKLLAKGIGSLSNAELMAILIGSGNRHESAVELSRRILRSANNNLNQLSKLSIATLIKDFAGIGEAKAISIVAALELGRRRKLSEIMERKKIGSSVDVADFFRSIIGDLPHEELWVLFLNQANGIVAHQRISQGGIAATVTDVRLIMKSALEHFAVSLILCHNHPSGNLEPSPADKRITHKLYRAGEVLDIELLDHVIVSDSGYFSFADQKMLKP